MVNQDKQIELIDISIKILRDWFAELKENDPEFCERYSELLYAKHCPPHIKQNLDALKSKISFKKVYHVVEKELWIRTYLLKRLTQNYWFNYILSNRKKIKKVIDQWHSPKKLVEDLEYLIDSL